MIRKIWIIVTVLSLIVLVAPASAPPKLSPITTIHSNPMLLQIYDLVLTTPTRAFVWNFTVNLAGKDAGSDRFRFVVDASGTSPEGSVPLVLLLSDKNLTDWLQAPLTAHSGQQFAYVAFASNTFASPPGSASTASAITIDFLPPATGTYHVVTMNPNAFANLVPGCKQVSTLKSTGQRLGQRPYSSDSELVCLRVSSLFPQEWVSYLLSILLF